MWLRVGADEPPRERRSGKALRSRSPRAPSAGAREIFVAAEISSSEISRAIRLAAELFAEPEVGAWVHREFSSGWAFRSNAKTRFRRSARTLSAQALTRAETAGRFAGAPRGRPPSPARATTGRPGREGGGSAGGRSGGPAGRSTGDAPASDSRAAGGVSRRAATWIRSVSVAKRLSRTAAKTRGSESNRSAGGCPAARRLRHVNPLRQSHLGQPSGQVAVGRPADLRMHPGIRRRNARSRQ